MLRAMAFHPMLSALMLLTLPLDQDTDELAQVREADAIACRLDVPAYQRFAMALEGEEQRAARRGWRKVSPEDAALLEYTLPAPITVAGSYRTRRIAFTGSGILAILDLPDPGVIAAGEQIANQMDVEPLIAEIVASGKATRAEAEQLIKFRKFLGERVIKDVTEPAAEGESFGSRTTVVRSISNSPAYPGKTLYGCAYRMEILDKDGTPL